MQYTSYVSDKERPRTDVELQKLSLHYPPNPIDAPISARSLQPVQTKISF